MPNVDLNEIMIFIKVAQLKSFSRAAEAMELPKSTVSSKLTHLEKRLGATLIHRTTRKLSLTQMGVQFYDRCVVNIENLKNAEEELSFSKEKPIGKIKVSAPVYFGRFFLPQIIAQYKEMYPGVHIEVILADRAVDLVAEGIDIAIRAGELADSIFISKKIGATHFALYATKDYLKNKPKIEHPSDLNKHSCIQFSYLGKEKWTLYNSATKQSVTIPMKGEIIVDDIQATKDLVDHHQGIAFLPAFSCTEATRAKELIAVLPDWRTQVRPLHFIYPSNKFLPPKIKQFIAVAEKIIKLSL